MTDHLIQKSAQIQEPDLFGPLREALHSGIKQDEVQSFNNQVIRYGLLAKAAYFYSDPNALKLEIPSQWLKPEIKKLITSSLELGFEELVIEFSRFLSKHQVPFPADSLISILNHAVKNLEFALKINHCIGPKGRFLAMHFDPWKLLHPTSAETFMNQLKKELRLFCFRRYRQAQPSLAFQQFFSSKNELKSAELPDFLLALKAQITAEEWVALEEFGSNKSKNIQFAWTTLKLSLNTTEVQTDKESFLSIYSQTGDFSAFTFLSPQNKPYQWPTELLVSSIPPDFIMQEGISEKYFQFIIEHSLVKPFCRALSLFPHPHCSNSFFELVLKKNLLKEDFPSADLFRIMDHESFNANCIQWLKFCGDQLDVEAFLQVCLLENQYWTDELSIRIMELRKSEQLSELYEFDAFWQLLPFKMNPASDLCKKIPEECSYFENEDFNFKNIIQFRKWLRTIKLNTA